MPIKIFTSYHAGPKIGLEVSISVGQPRFQKRAPVIYSQLAPKRWMLDNSVSIEKYKIAFNAILENLDPNTIADKLEELAAEKGVDAVTLLCFERPGEFCHRHMVADWLRCAGYEVVEVTDFQKRKPTPPNATQMMLF